VRVAVRVAFSPRTVASGADIGGAYDRDYAGGLALGAVYGLAAARAALAT